MSVRFDQLADFLTNEMRMSHIYQPAMLIQLLQNSGRATVPDIAKAILVRDPTQVEYYEAITKRQPGRVLTRNRGLTERDRNIYYLKGFNELSAAEVTELIEICKAKLRHFVETRVSDPWKHRKLSSRYISGSIRYEVLKRARMRCQLCGISAEIRALEVDHIVPRKFSGRDDISNLQALCYSCNAAKRDSDDADFRDVVQRYRDRETGCAFCDPAIRMVTEQNELSYAILASSPMTRGHTLIFPKRHVADYFALYQPELNAIQHNLEARRRSLGRSDESITGFNVGFDSGSDASQTIFHWHLNLVPRRSGDLFTQGRAVRRDWGPTAP